MDAIRVARAITGRDHIVKVEGGYHGHHDEVMISMKPALSAAGDASNPTPVPATAGITQAVMRDTIVIPYNDAEALERVLKSGTVACFIVEPAMQNISICLPDDGYLQQVRDITRKYGTMLIFDEVKTGITAGWSGATGHFGVTPDLVCLAKSIGGGLPLGAFGGSQECMDQITSGKVLHLGTFNGNPLCMAAAKAVLSQVCTKEATLEAIARNQSIVAECDAIIAKSGIPAHTVNLGAKACVTWSVTRVRNYRDYKATDFDIAFAQWIHHINRGLMLPLVLTISGCAQSCTPKPTRVALQKFSKNLSRNFLPKELMRPSVVRMVVRGVFRRCAWCGGKGAFLFLGLKKLIIAPRVA